MGKIILKLSEMRVKFVFIMALFGLMAFVQNAFSQEMELHGAERSYSLERSTLDSLDKNLKNLIGRLNTEKNKNKRDADKISELMAEAHRVSLKLDDQNKRVNKLGAEVKKLRQRAYKKYTVSIDSLTKIYESSQGALKVATGEKIKKLVQERAHVSPALPLFTFSPQLISQIKTSAGTDGLAHTIYADYLTNAMAEIDSNILIIKNKASEISIMLRLDEQAEEFMDELDGAQFLSTIESGEQQPEGRLFSDNTAGERYVFADNIIKIYEQLEPVMSELIGKPAFAGFDSLATEDYLILLQDTEKTLKLYRKIIREKMDKN
jgi:hypothetical protein